MNKLFFINIKVKVTLGKDKFISRDNVGHCFAYIYKQTGEMGLGLPDCYYKLKSKHNIMYQHFIYLVHVI